MEIFVTLLLAHILTEYPLQTNAIFKWKSKNLSGVFIHAGIYLVLAFLFLGPQSYRNTILLGFIIFSFIAHVIIDHSKNRYIQKTGKDSMAAYLADQLAHVVTLLPVVWLFPSNMEQKQMEFMTDGINLYVVQCLLIGLVFVTYASSIWQYYYEKTFMEIKKDYVRDYRDMGWRLLFFTTLFLKPWGWMIFIGFLFWLPQKQNAQKVLLNALCGGLGFLLFYFLAF